MNAAKVIEVVAFSLSALIAILGALGMATTMSMFRSAIFLMASFLGVAGLFILLSADLLSLLQIMMYIGGMLVMALFMVLFMPDPGGAMMAGMPQMMSPIERLFSLGLKPKQPAGESSPEPDEQQATGADAHGDHAEGDHTGMDDAQPHERHDGHHRHMDMSDMSMVTPVRAWAAGLAVVVCVALVALLLLRPAWPLSAQIPDSRSAQQVGSLLMGKYMVGFEGAGFLILIGIVGAVLSARSGRQVSPRDRDARVAVDAPPTSIESELIESEIREPPSQMPAHPHDDPLHDGSAPQHVGYWGHRP